MASSKSLLCRMESRPQDGNVGLVRPLRNAGWRFEPGSGLLPGPHGADFPLALMDAAALALQPGLAALAHVARQEIAAHQAVLGIGGGQRGHGPARAGLRIFPRNAGRLAVARERLARRGARTGEIALSVHDGLGRY